MSDFDLLEGYPVKVCLEIPNSPDRPYQVYEEFSELVAGFLRKHGLAEVSDREIGVIVNGVDISS